MLQTISSNLIKWEPYTKDDVLCVRFPLPQWHQIAGDINSDEEWGNFVFKYRSFVKCWVLKKYNDEPIALIYIFNEDDKWQKVSVHGGGWENPLMYYHGYVLMLSYLLEKGLKVRTYCQLSNPRAIRFSRSVGFVPYRYTEDEVFMWINEKRLKQSIIYKRFIDK